MNDKLDKIYKKINNNKDLLDGKYKERNDLLEKYNKENIEYLEILDKEIQNMELEIKYLEESKKELENLKLNNNNMNKYKTQLCRFYKNGVCDKKDKCFYAHGIEELKKIKKDCIGQLKCYDESCSFNHPNDWNPYDNKIECLYCKKGNCNKINKRYIHIKNNVTNFKFVVNKIILVNRIIRYLKKVENNNKLNNDIIKDKNETFINDLKNNNNINNLICQMENNLDLYYEKIIDSINNININDYFKINMKLHINDIKSKIMLLKYNLEDLKENTLNR